MAYQFTFDWKTVAAIGGTVVAIVLASKVKPDQATDALDSISRAFSNAVERLDS